MKKHIVLSFVILLISFTLLLGPAFSEENKNLQVKKQPEIQQVKPRKPVKVRLKRTGEGKYSWDLTGDDADDIVRTDKRLKKLLNIE
jgi:hypothetical protein